MELRKLADYSASCPLASDATLEIIQACFQQQQTSVDSEVSPPILLVLNLTQLKSCGIRL